MPSSCFLFRDSLSVVSSAASAASVGSDSISSGFSSSVFSCSSFSCSSFSCSTIACSSFSCSAFSCSSLSFSAFAFSSLSLSFRSASRSALSFSLLSASSFFLFSSSGSILTKTNAKYIPGKKENRFTMWLYISPHVKESGFRNLVEFECGKFSCVIRNTGLWNLEYSSRNTDPTNDCNP